MRPQFVFLAQAIGISLLTSAAMPIPLLPALLSMIVLAFSGKKYFLVFWLVELSSMVIYFYASLSVEVPVVFSLMNYQIAGVASQGLITHASTQTIIHIKQNLWQGYLDIGILGLALSGVIAVPVWFYYKVKKVMKGRVRIWKP